MQDGEWILMQSDVTNDYYVMHCHCDECGGGYVSNPYIAYVDATINECQDCPGVVPDAMLGFIKLAEWEK